MCEHRWIEDTWGNSESDSTPTGAQNLLPAMSKIVGMCLSVISGDTGQHWAVGKGASASQISGFVDACHLVANSMEQMNVSENNADDEDESIGVFLGGDQPCMADFLLWPFFSRALLCLKEFYPADVLTTSHAYSPETQHKFQTWVDSMKRLPAVQLSAVEERVLVDAWSRTGRLDWFDYENVAVGALHPHLAVAPPKS